MKSFVNFLYKLQAYDNHIMKRDSSHCGSGDVLAPFGNALKSFFVFKLFLVLSFLISLVTLAVTLINSVQQNSNNNNNNNNNANSNMQMNMNMNAKKRQLNILYEDGKYEPHKIRTKRFSNIFNLVDMPGLPAELDAIFGKIRQKKHFSKDQQQPRKRWKNIKSYQRAAVTPHNLRR